MRGRPRVIAGGPMPRSKGDGAPAARMARTLPPPEGPCIHEDKPGRPSRPCLRKFADPSFRVLTGALAMRRYPSSAPGRTAPQRVAVAPVLSTDVPRAGRSQDRAVCCFVAGRDFVEPVAMPLWRRRKPGLTGFSQGLRRPAPLGRTFA